ncbi:aspartyl/glutamyl-tRNA(Asn/Gln) amidotransferasesubunit C [Striga asiatica]|uniref:Aspartyl/glutamyl-tRNA(Asn/Gln) amidotransferasesubunit C n=1 Tax=Striga asiatica TaxID=4170 RepID=A0A5A7PIV7_STRAF|nr:aspartyl/glutamyl-tRNA(Asn/Gln) amidotransferasesubunit C [Striga asiatica]
MKLASFQNKRFWSARSSLEPSDVARLAETARISLTPQQVEEFGPKIRQLVKIVSRQQQFDYGVVFFGCHTETSNLRNDEPEIFRNRDAIIAAVPTYDEPYIKVPKVLNKE